MSTVATLWVKLALDSKDYKKSLANATTGTASAGAAIGKAFASIGKVAIVALAAAGAATVALGVKSFLAAAAVDELVAVNAVLGKNAGLAESAVKAAAAQVKGMGIEAAVSQRIVAEFIKAELDLAKASDIARVAQDSAVISQTNSSEAAAALIQGIVKLDTEILRTQGLTIDAKKAYDEFATTVGKTAQDLSAAEKQQAFMNAVMVEGGKIAGAYDAAMKEPGKVLRSFPRYFNDISVALGGTLKPIFTEAIFMMADWTKGLGKALQEGGALVPVLDAIKSAFEPLRKTLFGDMKPVDFKVIAQKLLPLVEGLAKLIKIGANVIQFFKDNARTIWDILIPALTALVIMWLATVIPAFIAALPAIALVIGAAAPLILIFLAIMAVVALLRAAWVNNWGGIEEKTKAVVAFVQKLIKGFVTTLEKIWKGIRKIFGFEEETRTTQRFADNLVGDMREIRNSAGDVQAFADEVTGSLGEIDTAAGNTALALGSEEGGLSDAFTRWGFIARDETDKTTKFIVGAMTATGNVILATIGIIDDWNAKDMFDKSALVSFDFVSGGKSVPFHPGVKPGGSFPRLFDSGGNIGAGEMGIIGGRGKELFVPNVAGQILSNQQIAGALGGGGNEALLLLQQILTALLAMPRATAVQVLSATAKGSAQ